MTLDKIIFYSKISLYNLIILLNVIDIIFGAILVALENKSCYSYYANTIYTIIISLIVIIGVLIIIYLMVKINDFNNYMIICNTILFCIFVVNFIYEIIVLSFDCNNINYKKYIISNIAYNSLGIIIYVVYALYKYKFKSQNKENPPIQKLENPVMKNDMDNDNNYDKSYEIM
jgi:hypothetical protein